MIRIQPVLYHFPVSFLSFLFLTLGVILMASVSLAEDHAPQEIQRLHVKGYVNAVAWNADGSKLAALSNFGGTITLWNTKNWTVINEFNRYGGAYSFNSLAFLPDGSLLTSAPIGDYSKDPRYANTPLTDSRYDTLQIFSLIQWNPVTGKPVHYIPDLGYPPSDLSTKVTNTFAVSNDGKRIAATNGPKVFLYDGESGSLIKELSLDRDDARSFAFSPDGKELAMGTMKGQVRFYDSKDGSLLRSNEVYSQKWYACSALAYSPNGKFIAVGKYKNLDGGLIDGVFKSRSADSIAVKILRVSDGAVIDSLVGSTEKYNGKNDALGVWSISWSPQGDFLAIGDERSFRLWKVESTPKLLLSEKTSRATFSTTFSAEGMLAAADNDEVIIYQ
jgi:WD40 repeat protein